MTAANAERRTKSARELAEQFGISERHVRRLIAEPRQDFLTRAAARRQQVVKLRSQGLTYAEIAEQMDISASAVGRLMWSARRHGEVDDAADGDRTTPV